ncbi:MAG: CRISPR-associated helicase Cas3' [Candidatus Aquicultorales bacterium]
MAGSREGSTYFWAKTALNGEPGVSVYEHMINIGHVAQCIAEDSLEILDHPSLQPTTVGALVALHDLGKISPGFQRKCVRWVEENNLARIDRNWGWDTTMESDHGKVSHAAVQTFLCEVGLDRNTAKYLSSVLGGHHGRLNPPNDRGYRPQKAMSESASQIDWDAERMATARMIWNYFSVDGPLIMLGDDSPSLWWLAGLTSIADWIGSDERFFPPEKKTRSEDITVQARNALHEIGFGKPGFIRNLSFNDLFCDLEKPDMSWTPNEMQKKALEIISRPGVYVIEAPMGTGKTEAALWAAYQLLVTGKATGIYFALPTQATSNRMHLRMNEFLRRISRTPNTSRLIHSNSWLTDQTTEELPVTNNQDGSDDAQTRRDWFASSKRALIASFGVGTIDQALLGVVAAKHFFVRHFALAGKVVILDEVHSYDLYTRTLIDKLIRTLEGLGCTVIVLSATLTGKRLGQITPLPDDVSDEAHMPYPLITGRREGNSFEPVAITPPASRTVKVDFVTAEDAAEEAIELAQNGGAVLWICNTVDAAQKQYGQLMKLPHADFPIGLLHSRFPYWRREEIENVWMERFGKGEKNRCGSILISTQIVEQSVDLDADLLITELAPTDMLLQRLGRLWRHEREGRPVDTPRMYVIEEKKTLDEFKNLEPKDITKELGSKAKVYAPYVILRSLEVWKSQPQVSIPSQIRPLIEATYEDRGEEPYSWEQLSLEWFGTDSARQMLAFRNSNLWQLAFDDIEGVQTRLNEVPTISLVLCKEIGNDMAVFLDESRDVLGGDQYRLGTAQAIHKNLVKAPKYCFDFVQPCPAFTDYLYEGQSVGIVTESGLVEVRGLKTGTRLFYSDELGLVIEK